MCFHLLLPFPYLLLVPFSTLFVKTSHMCLVSKGQSPSANMYVLWVTILPILPPKQSAYLYKKLWPYWWIWRWKGVNKKLLLICYKKRKDIHQMQVGTSFSVYNPLLNGFLFQSNISKRGTKVSSVNTKIVKHCHGRPSLVLSFPHEELLPYRCPPYWP
jgi:hypothetical protein